MTELNEKRRDDFLDQLANFGYNVGFGAKKNFASFDMINTIPSMVTLASIVIGIMSLVFDSFAARHIAAYVTISGVVGVYIETFRSRSEQFVKAGISLTGTFNKISNLYHKAASARSEEDMDAVEKEYLLLQETYQSQSSPNQVPFSDWYAHYKFFWQGQIGWIDERKKFRLFRDKIPLSSVVTIMATGFILIYSLR